MTVAVIQFGGSNCDRDTVQALESVGVAAELVWHEDDLPDDAEGIVLPGGFSYGDFLRAGAMAAHSPIMAEVRAAADDGTPVLGICNGAQIGCEASLTPGAFTTNESARFQCEHVHLRVENSETPWTSQYEEGEVIELPIAHGEGRFEISDDRLDALESEDRILFRYCDAEGNVSPEANPNGSKHAVAGVTGESDHVAVMMPHPERMALADIGGTDGRGVLSGFA
ncbi:MULTISPECIES: phosphoribosylformylglycinamidine synthase I [unclassified Halorhabdus]|uniref:phosphoribosylformylglycinamidine synthase I n=1 Tax=unclassified Halorhabdus TaxID=2621901 RepID=UPI0023DC7575|nr:MULTISPECIES: phosphoribosylformylglycinamidine synthase I [unclassified Halorhabdus]WEL18496.1 Phosphoribosylformylglycinamidine synthase subunit PurQ / glutaminase [Halorhabdus sp. SVX81]WEL22383.1 Phosphoribosylformylglycinamidine synthase subunit PurQ / glutaminase [Halorhabdus sp. BNX81]